MIIGLSLNTIASIVMLYPFIETTKNVEDDFILKMDKKGNYTQKKHIKDRKLGIIGFILFIIGFVLQIVGAIII
jgi:hypothetical protein